MTKRTKKTLSVSGKVMLRMVLGTILCAILYFSMLTIATGVFSKEVGYRIFEMTGENEYEMIEEHYYTAEEKPMDKSDFDLEDNQDFKTLLEVPKETERVFHMISLVLMLIVFAIFPYHVLWEFGNRDDTNVRYKGQRLDNWRGFRVGAFASAPYALLWVLLLLARLGGVSAAIGDSYAQIYRVIMMPFLPYINIVLPAASLQDCSIGQICLLIPILLYIPLVCGISYRMGHSQFSIREHLVFAKKEPDKDDEI